jgi:hypothetical protein
MSPTHAKQRIAFVWPLNAPITTKWFALSSLSQTTMDRSFAPEYSTEPSLLIASALTADWCRSNVATSACCFSPGARVQARIFVSADPV